MSVSFVFLFIFILFLIYYTRDILHPSLIITLEWGTILFLYSYVDHGLYVISDKTINLVLLWTYCFSFSSLLTSRTNFKLSLKLDYSDVSVGVLNILYIFFVLSNIALIVFIILAFGVSPIDIRLGLLDSIPFHINVLFYINTFSYVYLSYILIKKNSLSKNKIVLFLFIMVITSFIKMNKTAFFSLFFLLIYILKIKNKLKIRTIIILCIALLLLVTLLVGIRGDAGTISDFSIMKYLYIYILSPLTAFDFIVQGKVPVSNPVGGYSFVFFNRVLSLIPNISLNTKIFGPWVNVPLPTNVYTALAPFYLDFGEQGIIIFASLQGFFWGCMYNLQKRKKIIFQVFYGVLLYSLILQFFSDYFFYTFSVLIQIFIVSSLFVVKLKDLKYLKYNTM